MHIYSMRKVKMDGLGMKDNDKIYYIKINYNMYQE